MNNADRQQLLTQLAHTPVQLAELIDDLPQDSVRLRPAPDEFSVVENVCHLRDIELDGYSIRIQRLLTENHPGLSDIDGARLAVEREYNNQDLQEALMTFTRARQANVSSLSKASDSEFDREGDLEGVGKITLERLLEMMCEHDEGHVDELRIARRRLLKVNES
ncbi:MAG TPA: DinB family protein [Pyrinomonadaceae bacterium]|jgi:hypothetical protein|nr:DinB family protein [Pyrinomonadaceae bacterium]